MKMNNDILSSLYMNSSSFPIVNAQHMKKFLVLLAVLFLSLPVLAQNKKELQKKKEQLRKDIEYTNQLLNQTKKNKSTTYSQLIALNKKINYRSELINTIHDEIGGLDNLFRK